MSNRSKSPPGFGLEAYMKQIAAVVAAHPELAPLAYARAGNHVRSLAFRPENGPQSLQLQAIANQLDLLAAQATVPEVDPVDAEMISTYSDDPAGRIATEFDGVVADLAAAKIGDDGQPNSDLIEAALFDQFQKARSREVALPVQITPESADDSSNLLSDTVLIRYGGSAGTGSFIVEDGALSGAVVAKQEAQVIRFNGNDGRDAVPVTISVSPVVGGASATYPGATGSVGTYSYRPFARIFWGTGSRGQANEAYADVGRGVQLRLCASHVYVNVGMDSFTTPVDIGAGSVTYEAGSMYVTGHLGFFSGQSAAPVTRTVYVDQLGASATATHTIPLFARTLLPPQCSNTTATTQLDFRDTNNNTIYTLLYTNGTIVEPIPISGDAYQVRVTNNNGSAVAYRFCYQLAL